MEVRLIELAERESQLSVVMDQYTENLSLFVVLACMKEKFVLADERQVQNRCLHAFDQSVIELGSFLPKARLGQATHAFVGAPVGTVIEVNVDFGWSWAMVQTFLISSSEKKKMNVF